MLLFCKDKDKLDDLISSLRLKHPLTDTDIRDNIYDYLGIEVAMDDKKITLLQTDLINKILKTTKYENLKENVKTPAKEVPLVMDTNGKDLMDNMIMQVLLVCFYIL